jgi:hypothetical protein
LTNVYARPHAFKHCTWQPCSKDDFLSDNGMKTAFADFIPQSWP